MSAVLRHAAAVALLLVAGCADPASPVFADLAGHWQGTVYLTTEPDTWETEEWFSSGRMTALTIDVTGAGAATVVVTLASRATPITLSGVIARDGYAVTFRTTNGSVTGSVRAADDEMIIEMPSLSLNAEAYGVMMKLSRQPSAGSL